MIKNNQTFMKASIISVSFFLILLMLFGFLVKVSDVLIYNAISLALLIITSTLMIVVVLAIFLIITTNSLGKSPYDSKKSGKEWLFVEKYLKLNYWLVRNMLMPMLQIIVRIFNLDSAQLERFFIDFNNNLVKSLNNKYEVKDIVILLPHCLQNRSCEIKVTNGINNCKRCGRCNIGDIAALSEKWGTDVIIVTGGTAARAALANVKPKAVVSVACERDLASGIMDVRNIPVTGVLNSRPNGPCVNTKVDIQEIENALKQMIITLSNT